MTKEADTHKMACGVKKAITSYPRLKSHYDSRMIVLSIPVDGASLPVGTLCAHRLQRQTTEARDGMPTGVSVAASEFVCQRTARSLSLPGPAVTYNARTGA